MTYNDLPLAAVIYAPPGQLQQNDKLLMTSLPLSRSPLTGRAMHDIRRRALREDQ